MQITDHGVFELYSPDLPEHDPRRRIGVLFCRNGDGVDWYTLKDALEPGAALVEVDPQSGRFLGATGENGTHDYSTRWPAGKHLLEVRPAEAIDGLDNTQRYYNGAFEPAPPPLRTSLFKTEIYARMSDDELDLFDAGIEQAGTRTRLMWRDCTQVEADSPFFPLLMQQLTTAFGPARAGQILSLDL